MCHIDRSHLDHLVANILFSLVEEMLFPASIPLLEKYKWPVVHLSLHPFYWTTKAATVAQMFAAMVRFPYIYDTDLKRVTLTLAHVDGSQGGFDYVLSSEPLIFDESMVDESSELAAEETAEALEEAMLDAVKEALESDHTS